MTPSKTHHDIARMELANRVFFRLYQCANLLHKTGSRAVESEGLTTQQWAVLGALSREEAQQGMGVNELARYLMVSRQNLAGVIGRMERDGHIRMETDEKDRRARLIKMTDSGREVWLVKAQPKITPTTNRPWTSSRWVTSPTPCTTCSSCWTTCNGWTTVVTLKPDPQVVNTRSFVPQRDCTSSGTAANRSASSP